MEKKPIKRNENIVKLSREHHTSLLFCWKIRNGLKNGTTPERIKKYVFHFWENHMFPHFKQEEEILFAPVKDEKVQKALDDHRDIGLQVESLHDSGTNVVTSLLKLADTVDNHIRYEERDLFPHLEEVLSSQQLEEIGRQMQDDIVHVDDYEDDFWIRKA